MGSLRRSGTGNVWKSSTLLALGGYINAIRGKPSDERRAALNYPDHRVGADIRVIRSHFEDRGQANAKLIAKKN